jgi:hypothetical protein
MFSYLTSIFNRLFRPSRIKSDSRIFAYFDGQKWQSIDPIHVILALENHPVFSAEKHLQDASQGDFEAVEIIANAVCDVFNVSPYYNGSGLTIAERKALLDTFYLYCEAVKKNI